jgi:peptide/nickel transport system substrate-binding protein
VQTLEHVQAIFPSAGVEANVRLTDWPGFSTNHVQKSEHQIALLGWLNIVDPDRMLYGQLSTGGPLNRGGYSNAEVDAALRAGREALDIPARAEAYRKAAAILAEEVPHYIISYQGYQMFAKAGLPVPITASSRGYLRGAIMGATN